MLVNLLAEAGNSFWEKAIDLLFAATQVLLNIKWDNVDESFDVRVKNIVFLSL